MKTGLTILHRIADQLAATSGVDPQQLDASRLQWIIDARCRHLHLKTATAYAEHLKSSPEEIDALIDAIVVPETRFFRDYAVFEHIRLWASQSATDFSGDLRILSAPCSTGQEAYSLAATLHEAGLPLSRFTIDAFDLSTAALDKAGSGLYPEEALRNLSAEQRRSCGTLHHKQWKMHDALRRRIHFERRNLAEPSVLGDAQYHLILCRNLFIYLRPQARAALAQSLAAALIPGGRLILGTADRVEELSTLFSPLKPAASFAFTHRQHKAEAELPAISSQVAASLIAKHPHTTRTRKSIPATPAAAEAAPATADALYQRALQHQQHGDLRKAEHRCRQALYLDPKYLPALELLETLWLQHPSIRLRRALAARIDRSRGNTRVHPSTKSDAALEETA
jgi:chemotaxis protein methyltransferase WspC